MIELQDYHIVAELYNVIVSVDVCRPDRVSDKSMVKNNMSNNGEFVAHLDSIIR